jgi:hypothetical protein
MMSAVANYCLIPATDTRLNNVSSEVKVTPLDYPRQVVCSYDI